MFWFKTLLDGETASRVRESLAGCRKEHEISHACSVYPVVFFKPGSPATFVFNQAAKRIAVLNDLIAAESCDAPVPAEFSRVI